eukprot:450829-Rhodomonas_salina.1
MCIRDSLCSALFRDVIALIQERDPYRTRVPGGTWYTFYVAAGSEMSTSSPEYLSRLYCSPSTPAFVVGSTSSSTKQKTGRQQTLHNDTLYHGK